MALHKVNAPDGYTYTIDAPEGTSEEELMQAVTGYKQPKKPSRESKIAEAQRELDAIRARGAKEVGGKYVPVVDDLEEFVKGIPRGAVNIGELAALGISEGLGAGQETRDKIKSVAESARSPFAADAGPEGDTIGGTIGEGLGSIVPMGLMALAGPLGWAGAATTGIAAGAGEATDRARQAGATEDQVGEAGLWGALVGTTEVLPLGRLLGKGGKSLAEGFFKRYAKTASGEGLQEAAAATAQNMIEQQIYNPNADILNMDVAKEGGVGAAVGVIAQGLVDLVTRGKSRGVTPTEEEPLAEVAPAPTAPTAPTAPKAPTLPVGETVPLFDDETDPNLAEQRRLDEQAKAAQQKKVNAEARKAKEKALKEQAKITPEQRAEQEAKDAAEARAATPDLFGEEQVEPTQEELLSAVEEVSAPDIPPAKKPKQPILKDEAVKETDDGQAPIADTEADVGRSPTPSEQVPVVGRGRDEPASTTPPVVPDGQRLGSGDGTPSRSGRRTATPDDTLVTEPTPREGESADDFITRAIEEKQAAQRALLEAKPAAPIIPSKLVTPSLPKITPPNLQRTPKKVTPRGNQQQQPIQASAQPAQQEAQTQEVTPPVQTKPQLVQEALQLGLKVNPRQTKAQIQKQVDEAKAAGATPKKAEPTKPTVKTTTPKKAPPKKLTAKEEAKRREEQKKQRERNKLNKEALEFGNKKFREESTRRSPTGARKPRHRPNGIEDLTKPQDVGAVLSLITNEDNAYNPAKKKARTPANAAKDFFSGGYYSIGDALNALAYNRMQDNLGLKIDTKKRIEKGETEFDTSLTQQKENELTMQWIRENLSEGAVATVEANENIYFEQNVRRLLDDQRFLEIPQMKALIKELDARGYDVQPDADGIQGVAQYKYTRYMQGAVGKIPEVVLSQSLHPDAIAYLQEGNLTAALRITAMNTPDPTIARIASALAENMGDTRVEIVEGEFKGGNGRMAVGEFHAQHNKIKLADTALAVHTLLHEATHAATEMMMLTRKSHPSVRGINDLFNKVKDQLPNAYGSTDVFEFVAEAFSNPRFRRELANIRANGEPYNVLERLWHSVSNIMRTLIGLPHKQLPETAERYMDKAIHSILTPMGYADPAYYRSTRARSITTEAFNSAEVRPYEPAKHADNVRDTYEKLGSKARRFLLSLLPSNAISDLIKQYPAAVKIERLIRESAGYRTKRTEQNMAIYETAVKWASKNPDKQKILNDIGMEATLEEVDPSYSVQEAMQKYGKNPEKMAVWRSMQGAWQALGKEGQNLFKTIVKVYETQFNEFVKLVENHAIDSLGADATPEAVANIRKDVREAILSAGRIHPYIPLKRRGDYWLKYNGTNGERYAEAFETANQRARAMRELETLVEQGKVNGSTIETVFRQAPTDYRDAPPASFVYKITDIMKKGKVDKAIIDNVMSEYLQSLPERSLLRSFRKREGIYGADRDMIKVFAEHTYSTTRSVANIKYGGQMRLAAAELNKEVEADSKNLTDTQIQRAQDAKDELIQHIDFTTNPQRSEISKRATSFGFHMLLGGNVSTALITGAQIPLVAQPILGGEYGMTKTFIELNKAFKIITNGSFTGNVTAMGPDGKPHKYQKRAWFGLEGMDFEDKQLTGKDKELAILKDVFMEQGQMSGSFANDLLDVRPETGTWGTLKKLSSFMFHHSERITRQTIGIAAYNLELNALRGGDANKTLTDEQLRNAAMKAVERVEYINGSAQQGGAPRIAQGNFGAVIYLFKRYSAMMTFIQYQLLAGKRGMFRGTPEERKIARKQFAGMVGMSGLLAGLHGVPLYGGISMLFDALFTDDDEEDFDTMVRKQIGEVGFKGALNYMTNLDISSRVALSDLIFRDPYMSADKSHVQMLLEYLGGPVVGIASSMERGYDKMADGDYYRGFEAMAPAAVRNGLKAIRYAQEGVKTSRQDPVIGETSGWNELMQGLGFAPANYTLRMEQNAKAAGLNRLIGERGTDLRRKYYLALRMGDNAGMSDVMEDIMEYNRKYPTVAISASDLLRSLKAHAKSSANMYYGLNINPRLRSMIVNADNEYTKASIWD